MLHRGCSICIYSLSRLLSQCASGGIGRRAGFRFLCLTACGFESHLAHQRSKIKGDRNMDLNRYFDKDDVRFAKIVSVVAVTIMASVAYLF